MTEAFLSKAMDRHGDAVYRLALCRLQNTADAEDAFQDTFLAFFQENTAGWDDDHVKAWLLRVAINKSNDIARRRRRMPRWIWSPCRKLPVRTSMGTLTCGMR